MFELILPLLRRFWFLVPLAGAAAFGAFEHHEAAAAAARATQLEQQLGAAQASIAQLRAGIDAQNAGVQRILQQGVANEQAAHQLAAARAAAAQRVRVIYQTRVQRIEAAPVPATCASAAAWAAGQAQSLAAGWGK